MRRSLFRVVCLRVVHHRLLQLLRARRVRMRAAGDGNKVVACLARQHRLTHGTETKLHGGLAAGSSLLSGHHNGSTTRFARCNGNVFWPCSAAARCRPTSRSGRLDGGAEHDDHYSCSCCLSIIANKHPFCAAHPRFPVATFFTTLFAPIAPPVSAASHCLVCTITLSSASGTLTSSQPLLLRYRLPAHPATFCAMQR
jgi:hypothetical protein